MAIDPKDVDELQRALNDSAGKASVLWTTFITFELYLVIAFGSVTHRNLFLEDPVKLPLFSASACGKFSACEMLLYCTVTLKAVSFIEIVSSVPKSVLT